MYQRLIVWLAGILMMVGCADRPGSFAYDLHFLQQHDSGLIVLKSGEASVLVSPKYQAKVFTSTAAGEDGPSFGWIHYKAFDGPADSHMNAYGGENRLWLGPEGGRFSLFFPAGAKMEFNNWKTPAAFDTESWTVEGQGDNWVDLRKDMQLVNYSGTRLHLMVDRAVTVLARTEISQFLSLSLADSVQAVGYRTVNILTNTGSQAWTDSTGMPCIWLLDMFNPSPATTIIIPYEGRDSSRPATTDYFGEIPGDRIKYENNVLYFTADGKSRGKLGMHPKRAKPMIGSYDSLHRVLTITVFDLNGDEPYLNQEWNTVKPPFSGDAVNAYNDGPLADGSQMGPFYELESVSPAAFLAPRQSLTHHHSVFHFTGPETALDPISRQLLGVSVSAFPRR
jgi:hypothetical protein